MTMVAIDGACMGGGTELSLACDYRVCSDNPKTSIGLPEVKLGILPGAGGTQRLPRLVSLTEALPIMLTGSPVNSRKAKKIGLIDDVMPVETMIELCRKLLRSSGYKRYERKKGLQGESSKPLANEKYYFLAVSKTSSEGNKRSISGTSQNFGCGGANLG